MRVTFNQKILMKAIEEAYKAIDSLNIFLPLRSFYFEVKESSIIIKSSNGNFSILREINNVNNAMKIESLGTCLIPAYLFINIIKKCEGEIQLIENDNVLYIVNNNDKYEINLSDTTIYPVIDFNLYGVKIKVNSNKLKNAIKNVLFATSQIDDEMILGGVNFKLTNNKLVITATDSYRLAQETIELEDNVNESFDVTVYNKNIKEFIPIDTNENVDLYVNEYKMNLVHKELITQTKIIDAPYKDISKIFDVQFSKQLQIGKKDLSDAINKAIVISSDNYNKIRLEISKEKLCIISVKDEIGNSRVVIPNEVFDYNGDDMVITLNHKYLKEAIGVFDSKILINLNSQKDIILITSSNSSNKQIISPLKSY